jgi:hypothetical protein
LLKLLKNIVSLLLLLIIVFSSSGFTILTHYCSGSKTTTRSILPELAGKRDDCGGMSCNSRLKLLSERETISKASCCKENSSFYKIAVVDNPPTNRINFKPPVGILLYADLHLLSYLELKTRDFVLPICLSKPPPLAGKHLVILLNQLRIPLPASIS